jgi:hypothetical protein
MAKTVTTTISVSIVGDGYGGSGPFFNQSIVNATGLAPGSVNTINGATTVTVPATALGVVIVPPAGSALVKTYKGVSGDTGIATSAIGTTVFVWTAAQIANFVIATTGIETIQLIWT